MDRLEHPAVFVVSINWDGTAIVLVEARSFIEAKTKAKVAYPGGIVEWAEEDEPVVFTDGISKPYGTA